MNIKELESIIEIVDTINYQIIEKLPGDFGGIDEIGFYPRLKAVYITGHGWYIDLDDINLWSEDEDPRHYIEEKDDYEPLKPFLIRQIILVRKGYNNLTKLK